MRKHPVLKTTCCREEWEGEGVWGGLTHFILIVLGPCVIGGFLGILVQDQIAIRQGEKAFFKGVNLSKFKVHLLDLPNMGIQNTTASRKKHAYSDIIVKQYSIMCTQVVQSRAHACNFHVASAVRTGCARGQFVVSECYSASHQPIYRALRRYTLYKRPYKIADLQ